MQWEHNRRFLETIETEYADWIVTCTLYVALHAIEALLEADGARSRSSHKDRLAILQSEQRYARIFKSFKPLYDLAHVARYSATPDRWISAGVIYDKVIRGLLYPIEDSVRKLLANQTPPLILPAYKSISMKR